VSAELLREAAALMRANAAAAHEGPWTREGIGGRRDAGYVHGERGQRIVAHYVPDRDIEHIASWHPVVALAVADWLDHAAARAESKIEHGGKPEPVWLHERDALAVARAYLGRES